MTCREVTELATDYELGALSPGRRLRFRWHVSFRCKGCRRYLRQLRATVGVLRLLSRSDVTNRRPA